MFVIKRVKLSPDRKNDATSNILSTCFVSAALMINVRPFAYNT